LIQKFDGHHAEVWALATSNRGDFVVTGSHDKSLRVWEKTDEPLFLEEEREREMEQLYDNNLANELQTSAEGEEGDEVEAVTKTTSESMMAGERIMEAIELADADLAATKAYEEEKIKMGEMGGSLPKPTRHPELATKGDITPVAFVMGVLRKIPAASMEDALLVLPFRQVVSLLGYLDEWALAVSPSPLLLVNDTNL
jgi:U3 small nucleolar RNA-associated protein 12